MKTKPFALLSVIAFGALLAACGTLVTPPPSKPAPKPAPGVMGSPAGGTNPNPPAQAKQLKSNNVEPTQTVKADIMMPSAPTIEQ